MLLKTYRNVNRKGGIFSSVIADSLKPLIGIILLIFIIIKYNDVADWLRGVFRKRTNYYTDPVADLPKDKTYYQDVVKTLYEHLNGLNPLNTYLYEFLNHENKELKYLNDIYLNPEYPTNTMAMDIKGDLYDNAALMLLANKRFKEVGIPF